MTHSAARQWPTRFLVALSCCLPIAASADRVAINLQRNASYDPALPYQKAFTECELATSIPNYVAKVSGERVGAVVMVDDASQVGRGLALAVRVAELDAPSGGGWSGSKGLTLEAQLYRDGTLIETFRSSHRARGPSVGWFRRSTCSLLDRNAQVLGDQLAEWVKRKLWALGLED